MDEKSQRHYAAIEALKLGYGGIHYIAGLFGVSEKTVSRGIEEVKKGMASPQEASGLEEEAAKKQK